MSPILVDLSCQCPHHTDQTLEFVFKASGDDPGDSIWEKHPSPYIRRIVELFTSRGLDRIGGLREEMMRWIAGSQHRAGGKRTDRPAGAMIRWTPEELAVTKLYLESLPPAQFVIEDWMLLVDYLVQRYLSPSDMRTDAEWLATRSSIMGRVQAAMTKEMTARQADAALAAIPANPGPALGLTPIHRAVLAFGKANAAERVAVFTNAARQQLRRTILDHTEAQMLGGGNAPRQALQSRLQDDFGAMNRDWRRIAVTEAGENLNQGVLASLPVGARVRRVEKYRGACPYCQSINGVILTVADPAAPDKDGEKQVWVGKTNIGRSASPRRREGGKLVPRQPHEMWWVPAGTVHPHCRGGWVVIAAPKVAVDAKFSDWLDEVLKRKP